MSQPSQPTIDDITRELRDVFIQPAIITDVFKTATQAQIQLNQLTLIFGKYATFNFKLTFHFHTEIHYCRNI